MISKNILLAVAVGAFGCGRSYSAVNDTVNLPTVVAEAPAKVNVTLLPLNTNIITSAEIEKSAESSLLPILVNKIPGLFATERGFAGYGISGGAAGTVSIRGVGGGNKVLFMIDGQPQWASIFGHSLPDAYVTNGVERVEVVKGPSSLLYGSNAMGGSVNIVTKHQQRDGVSGRARAEFGSFTTERFGLNAGLRKGKFAAYLAGAVDRSNGSRERSEFWNANELMQLQYRHSREWEAGATVTMNQTMANNPGTIQAPLLSMWTKIYRGTASVYAKDNYGNARGGAQAYINWGRHWVDDGYAPEADPTDYIFNSTDYNMGFTLYQTMNLWQGNDLSAGVDFVHWGGHKWNNKKEDIANRYSDFKGCENEIAGYVMMQQGFWDDLLSLNAGVRLQHSSQFGNEWVPQAGFILKPYRGGSLKFSFSKGFRAPNIRELYFYQAANPGLRPEYMWNYDVEFRQWLLGNRLNFGVSFFFIDGKDGIQLTMIDGRMKNMNSGSFINKGFEIDAAYRISRLWTVSANYSYLHTSNSSLLGAPKNKLNAEVNYSPCNFEFTLESSTIRGLHTGAPDGATQNYSLLNFQAAYTYHAKCDIRPFVKADNILNKHYEILYGCPMPGTTIMGGLELSF